MTAEFTNADPYDMIAICKERYMAISEADKRATKKYRKKNMLCIAFRLSRKYDADLIEIYQSIPNKMEWFRSALRATREK